ncbi:ABC transporter ATP-binding protein [Pseudorhodoplanes sinuspersici]|uniref:Branched-chain amino acid ABC transporter ATP-binding protein n=1 Tax=Pseudorhodoplanes sinuspersici TaxID=1235591 RepID=A0A1W6ZK66_9HYPH|nr:ABC transporter ATP-binding protein [Pseudorhodoplanes sinuspersici]ARP97798.1 branched-chain amino acid ABC transporter ATP-binding protein [Pseudorhodoplanes sinuspersici]RKE68474.1 amino acid/amide ABC transporter ATP-binding protein 1 (HAAT family) [Pseudorhodoplanes sinuspersici]
MSDLLEARNVSRAFGGLHVTRDVNFKLAAGDRVALIGPNGAGKTTLVNLITGDIAPSEGQFFMEGDEITGLSIPERVRRGLVRTFQTTRLFANLTVADNVALAIMQRKRISRRLFSSATELPEVRAEWSEILGNLGLDAHAYRKVVELAYGQQRLIELAIGLALHPKVLLLDEPAAGVPHDEAPRILAAINRLPADIAVLMIEHDMDLVFKFARRVLVLAAGRLIFEGSPDEVTANQDVRRAYLGSYADARRTA